MKYTEEEKRIALLDFIKATGINCYEEGPINLDWFIETKTQEVIKDILSTGKRCATARIGAIAKNAGGGSGGLTTDDLVLGAEVSDGPNRDCKYLDESQYDGSRLLCDGVAAVRGLAYHAQDCGDMSPSMVWDLHMVCTLAEVELKRRKKWSLTKKCSECFGNYGDPEICPGCMAYKDHTA